MSETILERQRAMARYRQGESATAMCASLGRSREWLYKWLKRHDAHGAEWAEERSRRPRRSPAHLGSAVEAAILAMRRSLAQRQLFHGAQARRWHMTAP